LDLSNIAGLTGCSEDGARHLTDALVETGIVRPGASEIRLIIAFPLRLSGQFFPELFPKEHSYDVS
jgi:hypothetical protein